MARHAGQPQLPRFSLGQKVEINPALGRKLNSIQPGSLRHLFRQMHGHVGRIETIHLDKQDQCIYYELDNIPDASFKAGELRAWRPPRWKKGALRVYPEPMTRRVRRKPAASLPKSETS